MSKSTEIAKLHQAIISLMKECEKASLFTYAVGSDEYSVISDTQFHLRRLNRCIRDSLEENS